MKAGNRYGYIDKAGNVAIQAFFERADSFSEGLALVRIDGKMGYINKSGGITIAPRFDDARRFSEGFAAVKISDKWGYIDQSGTVVIKLQFDTHMPFTDGLAQVTGGAKSGYINKSGVYVWQSTQTEVSALYLARDERTHAPQCPCLHNPSLCQSVVQVQVIFSVKTTSKRRQRFSISTGST